MIEGGLAHLADNQTPFLTNNLSDGLPCQTEYFYEITRVSSDMRKLQIIGPIKGTLGTKLG